MDVKTEKEKQEEVLKPNKILGIRHLQALLLFTCIVLAYAMRVNMSVAIVAMTDPNASSSSKIKTFPDWSKSVQDTILSSFFWGYVVTQVPAGMLSERFGSKHLLTIAVTLNSIVSLLLPLAATMGGWKAVCASRVLQGLGQAAIFPSVHGLQARWAPLSERSRFTTYIYSGVQFGTVIELMTAGFLAGSDFGWPSIFYTLGMAGVIWTAAWLYMGADSPRQHKWASEEEIKYIEATYDTGKKETIAPMRKIFTSIPFLALIFTHCGQNWGFWTLLTEMPSYMNSVLGVDIKSNGLLLSLPYSVMYILSFVFSFMSDYGINNQIVSRTVARKIANTIAYWGPAIFLIGFSYTPTGDIVTAVGLLTMAVGLNGAHSVGFGVNHIDLSPNYAATLMGITNMIANFLSILAPLAVGLVIKDETKASDWRIVFFISAGIYFLGNLCFIMFGSAEQQPWNSIQENDTSEIESAPEKKEEIPIEEKRNAISEKYY